MNTQVLLLGIVVGTANFLFRYLPLRLKKKQQTSSMQRGITALLLDSIGIASICALLVVSSVPDIQHSPGKLIPTLVGFGVLGATFYKTRSIILSTLLSALGYGVTWKILMVAM
ncbi:L-valine transporter subunit YgaH [Paramixta manurensis]